MKPILPNKKEDPNKPSPLHLEVDKEIDRQVFMVRYGQQLKVWIIVLICLALVGLGVYIVYRIVVPPPECTLDDHCQSGHYCHEKKCVAIVQEHPPADLKMQVMGSYVFPSANDKTDVLGIIKNPNSSWGIKDFDYTFVIRDSANQEVGRFVGQSYILPGEEKYLIKIGQPVSGLAQQVEVLIEPKTWIKSPEVQQPNIDVKNIFFSSSSPLGQAALDGRLINSSSYSFEEVEVATVLKGTDDKPVGVNYTTLNALLAGEERDFRLVWFTPVSGGVASQSVKVEANVYDTRNFLLQMQTEPQKFQQYDEPANEVSPN